MGFDASYQALPDGCTVLEHTIRDPKIAEVVSFVPYFVMMRHTNRPRGDAQALLQSLVNDLIAEHPGIEDRNYCYYDRRWDALHYLLSEGRRNGAWREHRDLGTKAVRGSIELNAHAQAVQGIPVMYVPPEDVQDVAAMLASCSPAKLRHLYDPVRMEQQGVYKFWADRATEVEWNAIMEFLHGLSVLYEAAAVHHEGVLVVID